MGREEEMEILIFTAFIAWQTGTNPVKVIYFRASGACWRSGFTQCCTRLVHPPCGGGGAVPSVLRRQFSHFRFIRGRRNHAWV
jgi:hypothetical protein